MVCFDVCDCLHNFMIFIYYKNILFGFSVDPANLTCLSSCLKPIQLDAVTYCHKPCDTIIDVTAKVRQLRDDLAINRKNTTCKEY